MRTYTGIHYSALPPPNAPNFQMRLRKMLGEIDYYLRDSSSGFQRIIQGETPDGSGNTIGNNGSLTNYFYLPGRSGGQTGYGGDGDGQGLTLSSTRASTKGFIYLGSSAAFDETNVRLGLGVTAPDAKAHTKTASALTTNTKAPTSGSLSGWTGTIADIDEEPYSDADYIYHPTALPTSSYAQFPTVTAPGSGGSFTIHLRYRWEGSNSGSAGVQLFINLQQPPYTGNITNTGNIQIVAPGVGTNTGWIDYPVTLSAAELASISDWSAFRVGFGFAGGGIGYSQTFVGVSYVSIWTTTPATDHHLRMTTGSTVVTNFDAGGNLGMGITTTTPSSMIHLAARTSTTIPLILDGASSQTGDLLEARNSSGNLLGRITSDGYLESRRLLLKGSTSGTVTLSGGTTPTSHTLTIPTAQGAANTLLNNDGSGNLSWVTPASIIDVARTWTTLQTFKDSTFKVVRASDATNTLAFSLTGSTNADLTLAWSGTLDRTITFPDSSGTLLTTATGAVVESKNYSDQSTSISDTFSVVSEGNYLITLFMEITTNAATGATVAASFDYQDVRTPSVMLARPIGNTINFTNLGQVTQETVAFRAKAGSVNLTVTVTGSPGLARYAVSATLIRLGA